VVAVFYRGGAVVVVGLPGFTVGAVVVAGTAVVVGFMDLAEAAAGFMGLLATVAGLTWVMDGVATH
jgi:hypothetical protein